MANLIEEFYTSFSNLDAESMVSCYHDDIVFEDPAFGVITGDKAKNMWRMLCESQKGKDFQVTYSNVAVDGEKATAYWEAKYIFSKTNRKVHNKIHAKFVIKEGKIIEHIDSFNLHGWAGQALGFKGWLLGWTNFFKNKLNQQTNSLLEKYEKRS